MMRIVLVDDHTLVRAGLRALLDDMPDITVVAEAADGASGLEAVRLHRPDLLITDLAMAGMNGIELTEKVTRKFPDTRVIVLSMYSSREHVLRAMSAGASAYLLKDAAESELGLAMAAVAKGEPYLSAGASRRLDKLVQVDGASNTDPLALLTARQREVLKLIAEGAGTKQIAHQLDISPKTVEVHRSEMMSRLGIRDIAGLVRLAVRAGLVSTDR
ncbi:MAG: response regulator transcription factor [Steroidobacteraceae bacterium]